MVDEKLKNSACEDFGKDISCSFCGREQDKDCRLIAGPGVYICEACVFLCMNMIFDYSSTSSNRLLVLFGRTMLQAGFQIDNCDQLNDEVIYKCAKCKNIVLDLSDHDYMIVDLDKSDTEHNCEHVSIWKMGSALALHQKLMAEILPKLTDIEAKVISLRFGLDSDYAMTIREVVKRSGLTREQVLAIERKVYALIADMAKE